MHTCRDCRTCRDYGFFPMTVEFIDKPLIDSLKDIDEEQLKKVRNILLLLQMSTVKVSAEDIHEMSAYMEQVREEEVALKSKSEANKDFEEQESNEHSENVPLICSEDRPNPTKIFNGLPFFDSEIIYDCVNDNNQNIDLLRPYEYCYKCYLNTGCQYLTECYLCGQLSFVGCGAKVDKLVNGSSTFFCCYCTCFKRDVNRRFHPYSEEYYHFGERIVNWEAREAVANSVVRKQYERRMILCKTENKYSERLYGNNDDPSEELSQALSGIYIRGMQSKEYVCSKCRKEYFDIIKPDVYHKGMLCIECCLKNFYNYNDIKMKHDRRVIFHYQMYDWGNYPASESFMQFPFFNATNISKEEIIKLIDCSDFVYDNSYRSEMNHSISIDVFIEETDWMGRKIVWLFSRASGILDFKLHFVTIEQYVLMVKCRYTDKLIFITKL